MNVIQHENLFEWAISLYEYLPHVVYEFYVNMSSKWILMILGFIKSMLEDILLD